MLCLLLYVFDILNIDCIYIHLATDIINFEFEIFALYWPYSVSALNEQKESSF